MVSIHKLPNQQVPPNLVISTRKSCLGNLITIILLLKMPVLTFSPSNFHFFIFLLLCQFVLFGSLKIRVNFLMHFSMELWVTVLIHIFTPSGKIWKLLACFCLLLKCNFFLKIEKKYVLWGKYLSLTIYLKFFKKIEFIFLNSMILLTDTFKTQIIDYKTHFLEILITKYLRRFGDHLQSNNI